MSSIVIADKYELGRRVGKGGMGVVYEATHRATRRRVALKMLTFSSEGSTAAERRKRFEREILASGALVSRHIGQVFDAGVDDETGMPFMVMEFIEGKTLSAQIKDLGPLRPDLALRIAAETCLGLGVAHAAGIIHRDIKPSNLMLAHEAQGKLAVKILDFGVAKITLEDWEATTDGGLTRTGSLVGSPHYMSPEQARGSKSIDHRSDLWSLGIVLYKMLSGRTPHDRLKTIGDIILGICSEPPTPIQVQAPWVSADIAEIVHRALRIDPAERFESAEEAFDAITALLPNGHEIEASMLTPLTDTERAGAVVRAPGNLVSAHTTMGVTRSGVVSPGRAPWSKRIAPGVLAGGLIAGAVGIYFAARPPQTPNAAAQAQSSAPVGVSEPMPAAAPVPSESAHAVVLRIDPPDSEVTIDGIAATANDGGVSIVGPPGRRVSVRIRSGDRSLEQDVAITDDGALPSTLALSPRVKQDRTKLPHPAPAPSPKAAAGVARKFE